MALKSYIYLSDRRQCAHGNLNSSDELQRQAYYEPLRVSVTYYNDCLADAQPHSLLQKRGEGQNVAPYLGVRIVQII